MAAGKSYIRVDAYDKATGRAKYTDDLCSRHALTAKIKHSDTAHAIVKAIDISEAVKIPGVVKVLTCFDVPKYLFPTAGHPWSTDPGHQDICDRLLLTKHVRYYGDDVAAVIAEDEISAQKAVNAIRAEYEYLPFVLDVQEAMSGSAPLIHGEYKNNILAHSQIHIGKYDEAAKELGLIRVEGWYDTPTVQHCHIENAICYSWEEAGKINIVSSTQIPHIMRRIIAQALGIEWGKVRVIKPCVGGGFGNKQDALYEPLCAWLSTQAGGRLVKLECQREETFMNTRVRHAIRFHIISWLREDGKLIARKAECYSNQGAYASHGHAVCANALASIPQIYPCENFEGDGWTVFTNRQAAGAMRGYGIPQATFAVESHTEDICARLGLDPAEYRRKNVMPKGYVDPFSKNELYYDTFSQTLDAGIKHTDYYRKRSEYANQSGNVRRGIGLALFWYKTGVWPTALETSACRMTMNQDGSIQLQVCETEIGQGADTAFSQMAAETLGIPFGKVHIVSSQDTDVTPFGLGAYASRQTYAAGMSIRNCAEAFKAHILETAYRYTRMQPCIMDIADGNIIRKTDGRILMPLGELATSVLYDCEQNNHLTMEKSTQIKTNAYSFGCCFAEVEVDIAMCQVKLINILNIHDAGQLINPALAEAQVHGGMSMGIGYALSEKMLYDSKTGRLLNGNLLDYKLPTMMDHPNLTAQFIETYEPTSAYGTKALGEPPVPPVAPAIRNAIFNATGIAFSEIPIRPHLMYEKFTQAGLIHAR